ncbi:histidine kinase [Candidatus Koribacter versatilis Ellin345]|uniref:Oxygen sensor histidine kinase NreB n=1 Tax=Koribacter versatilis (strain Ellin345) TaxID=204669 RepID=Q1IJ87_KORVE|nr:sensor histidine kinase [Candidatus Koribacter versatilis]ABF43063.1 histidine kinase [Candidatus Koribacter versatilis Ellin345]
MSHLPKSRAPNLKKALRDPRHAEKVPDVTELMKAQEELKSLSQKLITAHEEERSYLARELHDDTSQRLALLAIQLEALAMNLPQKKATLRAALMDMHKSVTDLAADIHALSRQLHPSVLDRLGAVAAIRGLCDQVRAQRGISVTFSGADISDALPRESALCLYRIAEEAITNAIKHGSATELVVELSQRSNAVVLTIRDNGSGFDLRAQSEGLGFLSMRERLRLASGSLLVRSASGEGTAIEASIPLSR